jgi:hypothetical protein
MTSLTSSMQSSLRSNTALLISLGRWDPTFVFADAEAARVAPSKRKTVSEIVPNEDLDAWKEKK